MTDLPIIFSPMMVRALLAGRKTMTRRLASREIINQHRGYDYPSGHRKNDWVPTPWRKVRPGDRLWVRENFHPWKGSASGKTICYVADGLWKDWGSGWEGKPKGYFASPMTSSMRMPRWASRLTLVVTATKIERLQEISEEDCAREGIQRKKIVADGEEYDGFSTDFSEGATDTARRAFEHLWVSLHGIDAWRQNPEVACISFRAIKRNIDEVAA